MNVKLSVCVFMYLLLQRNGMFDLNKVIVFLTKHKYRQASCVSCHFFPKT